jgi:WD40 repeat protein/osmotically-inducible protein OsmY
MRQVLCAMLVMGVALTGCGRWPGGGTKGGRPPTVQVPPGDPATLPKVQANVDDIRTMLRERFGEALLRTLRVDVADQGDGKRVTLSGEVPTEEVRQAVMKELDARIENMKSENFTLTVAGPLPLLLQFDARPAPGNLAAFSPDLSLTVTGDGELFETATGRRINHLDLDDNEPTSVAFSPDGKLLAFGMRWGEILLYTLPRGTMRVLSPRVQNVNHEPVIAAIAFTPDSREVAAVTAEHGELTLWDLATGRGRTIGAYVPQDSSRQYGQNWVVALSPDGKTIATSCWEERNVWLWDIAARAKKRVIDAEPVTPTAMAWSHNGKAIAVVRGTGERRGPVLFDVATGKATVLALEQDQIINAVAFSPDDRTLAAACTGDGVVLWDLKTQKRWLALEPIKAGAGYALAFSPDGTVLATDCPSLQPPGFRLWDVAQRPGGSDARAKLPPSLPDIAVHDDNLAGAIAKSIRGSFPPGDVRSLQVAVGPLGEITLTGTARDMDTKRRAEEIAAAFSLPDEYHHRGLNRVINDLHVGN